VHRGMRSPGNAIHKTSMITKSCHWSARDPNVQDNDLKYMVRMNGRFLLANLIRFMGYGCQLGMILFVPCNMIKHSLFHIFIKDGWVLQRTKIEKANTSISTWTQSFMRSCDSCFSKNFPSFVSFLIIISLLFANEVKFNSRKLYK
jgi:hypothetical protein